MRWPSSKDWPGFRQEPELPVTSDNTKSRLPNLSITVKSEHQIELKTTYWHAGSLAQQAFSVEANLFFPAELQSVHTEVFGNTFQTANYHTPEVALDEALQAARGLELWPGQSRPSPVEVCNLESRTNQNSTAGTLGQVTQQLQVTACVLRKAMRSAAKHLASLSQTHGTQHEMVCVEAQRFTAQLSRALADFEELVQPFRAPPYAESMQLSARMVQEFLFYEAESTLLKLLQLSSPSGTARLGSWPLHEPMQQMKQTPADESLAHAILSVQAYKQALGYHSPRVEEDESYTQYVKLLKRNARSSITLFHQERSRIVVHPVLVDVVGSCIAALSMLWAILAIYMGQRASHVSINRNPLGIYAPAVMVANVGGYVLKDRMKIWGQRYLTPVAQVLGWDFPERTAAIIDHNHQVVARYDESCAVMRDKNLDPELLTDRQQSLKAASMPVHQERVLVHRKRVSLHWQQWTDSMRAMKGLDDVLRYDLSPFCRKMEPAHEAYLRLASKGASGYTVEQVPCARVYRLHLAVRITAQGQGAPASSLHRATIVMDKAGIKRLELPGEETA